MRLLDNSTLELDETFLVMIYQNMPFSHIHERKRKCYSKTLGFLSLAERLAIQKLLITAL